MAEQVLIDVTLGKSLQDLETLLKASTKEMKNLDLSTQAGKDSFKKLSETIGQVKTEQDKLKQAQQSYLSDIKNIYNGNSNRYLIVTKYAQSLGKSNDYIDLHIDVPSQLISSYLTNYFTIDLGVNDFYDLRVVINDINNANNINANNTDNGILLPRSKIIFNMKINTAIKRIV